MTSLRRSLAINFFSSSGAAFVQFIVSILIARLLSPSEIGVFSMTLAVVSIAQIFRDFGVSTYLQREANLRSMEGDLLATHLNKWFPEWDYSSGFKSGSRHLAPEDIWLCFLPFFAIKASSLSMIDRHYKDGWDGHHEIAWPTILKYSGLTVVDIGGSGSFVAPENRNKYYLGGGQPKFAKSGSFGTLNIRLFPGNDSDMLWHPVKPFEIWVKQSIKRLRSMVNWTVQNKLLAPFKSSPHKPS